MTRFVVLIAATLLVGPAQAQRAGEVEELIAQLRDEDQGARENAAIRLSAFGPEAMTPAAAALAKSLSDPYGNVRVHAAGALERIGAPAVPSLLEALAEGEDDDARGWAALCLEHVGQRLKAQGVVLWSTVPRFYWKEFVGLLLLLMAWFATARWVFEERPAGRLRQAALFAGVSGPPTLLICSAVHDMITRPWAQGFLPDLPIAQVPLSVAVVLSVGFCTLLAAVWTYSQVPNQEHNGGEHELPAVA